MYKRQAKCHRLNRFVAVKILKEELAQDEEFRRRFRDESQAVAMLSLSLIHISRLVTKYLNPEDFE